jgi:uncharacterized protein (TIGR00725 family)
MRRFIVGVMGQGQSAGQGDEALAESLGELIAKENWILLTGGRDVGVMQAANKGAKKVPGSITVGILPNRQSKPSPYVDIPVITDMNEARNNINVLSSDVIVACGRLGPGTTSEVALALKAGKTVVLLGVTDVAERFFSELSGAAHLSPSNIVKAQSPQEAIEIIRDLKVIRPRGHDD